MRKYFGTDGIRGIANQDLSGELAFSVGKAGASVLCRHSDHPEKPIRVVVGSDTRLSKDMLSSAISAGVMSAGADVIDVGVVPTPAVAYFTRAFHADAGIVISASHNPMEYNGIKFFDHRGMKLPDEIELEIERVMDSAEEKGMDLSPAKVGSLERDLEASQEYVEFLCSKMTASLLGTKIALDCANGAAFQIAPEVFRTLGAEVITLGCEPDGKNINDHCGSTHVEGLKKAVLAYNCDFGFAYDGDADRLIAVDERGEVVDGDKILLIFAEYLKKENRLSNNTLVVTVMSNLGLHIAAKEKGIRLEVTKVGDRYVLENMVQNNHSLGGEQSGHMIFLEHNTTGDGILSSVLLAKIIKKEEKTLSKLASLMEIYPQVLINAKVKSENKQSYMKDPVILKEIHHLEKRMNEEGRVLIRPSGTEPLVRVMIEGKDQGEIQLMAQSLAQLIEERLG